MNHSGDAEILRSTCFGELVVLPATLASLHAGSVAPIKHRWLPEVHQATDCERELTSILGKPESWQQLSKASEKFRQTAELVFRDIKTLKGTLAEGSREIAKCGLSYASAFSATFCALVNGEIDLLPEKLANLPTLPGLHLLPIPRNLRARRHVAALTATNALHQKRRQRFNTESTEADAPFGGSSMATPYSNRDCRRSTYAPWVKSRQMAWRLSV